MEAQNPNELWQMELARDSVPAALEPLARRSQSLPREVRRVVAIRGCRSGSRRIRRIREGRLLASEQPHV